MKWLSMFIWNFEFVIYVLFYLRFSNTKSRKSSLKNHDEIDPLQIQMESRVDATLSIIQMLTDPIAKNT